MNEIFIYKIKCLVNGKIYIGQTKEGRKRWTQHKWCLNKNKHYNFELQNDWNKYNENNFVFEIIEKTTKELLNEKEQYWIAYYNSDISGYNKDNGGKPTAKEVYQYDFDGNFVNKYDSIYNVEKYGFNVANVYSICERDGKYKTHKNSIWSYKTMTKEEIDKYIKDNNINKYTSKDTTPKKIYSYDLNGNFIKEYPNIISVRNDGFDNGNISKALHGKRKTCHGRIWSYIEPINGKLIDYK